MTSRPVQRSEGMFRRLWLWLVRFDEAMHVTETSLLAERVAVLERDVASMRQADR